MAIQKKCKQHNEQMRAQSKNMRDALKHGQSQVRIKKWRSVLKLKYSEKEFSEPLTRVESMTFQIPVGYSNYKLWEIRGEHGHILGSCV